MTENDISQSQMDALINQIEDMLQNVSKKRMVEAVYVQDGLLDLLNLANNLEGQGS